MRHWDSSAIVPLLIEEPTTLALQRLLAKDPRMGVWWATPVECVSAIARRERSGLIEAADRIEALARLAALVPAWALIEPTAEVRETAIRLIQSHDLRAADALQLAAALVASEGRPSSLPFVSLDARLNEAALREGFGLVEVEE